jgi:hypothetical protein
MTISYEEAFWGSQPKMQQNVTVVTVTPAKFGAFERSQKFIDGLKLGKSIIQLAKDLDVDRATLYRDFDEWLKTSGPAYLQTEWLQAYEVMKLQNPVQAFVGLTRLVMKILEKQARIEVNVSQQNIVQNKLVVEIIDNSIAAKSESGAKESGVSDASAAT